MSTKNVFASLLTIAMLSACGGSDEPVDIAVSYTHLTLPTT